MRESRKKAKGEGDIVLFLTQEWTVMQGTKHRHDFLLPSQALLLDLNNDLFPSLPLAIRPCETIAFLGKWRQKVSVTCSVRGIF